MHIVSVVVCTLSRQELLFRVVTSLLNQDCQPENYEILIIDNSLEGDSYDIVHSFKNNRISIRYFHEKQKGLSFARNTGYKMAFGDIIAYIDDDAEAEKKWISGIINAFNEGGFVAVGGVILPIETKKLDIEKVYDKNREIKDLFGSNMAIKKSVLIKLNGFNTELGRRGKCKLAGEECEFFVRLIRNKEWKIKFDNKLIVYHPTQFTFDDFLLYKYCGAVSRVIMDNNETISYRLYFLIKVLYGIFIAFKKYLTRKKTFFVVKCELYYFSGYILSVLGGKSLACRKCIHKAE